MRILVIQTASIGDVILATPVLEGLHREYPSAHIDLLVKKGMEGLFRGHPWLHSLLLWDKGRKYKDFFRLLGLIRKEKYNVVVNVQRFALTGLLTACSGAETSIGFDKNPFSFLFSRQVRHRIEQGVHEVERNLSLLAGLISAGQETESPLVPVRPMLYPTDKDYEKVNGYKSLPFVTLSPASLWYTKQFPAEKWVELIKSLPPEVIVYLLGSGVDTGLCSEIVKLSGRPGIEVLAGRLSLLESAALMSDALMNYTNDSAPMHLASAVNAPVTVVYCSTVPEFGFGPRSSEQWIIQNELMLKCRPCGLHGRKECPLGHFDCARRISASQFPDLRMFIPKK